MHTMKTLACFFAIFFMTISLYSQTEPLDTDGNGYRNISSLDHLRWVSENESCWGDKFELDNDIDAKKTRKWNDGQGFLPIGNDSIKFTGKFNGQAYKICNLYINRATTDYIGLFGYAEKAIICNIGIVDCNITGQNDVGSVIGMNYNATINNCYAIGNVTGVENIGGIVGENYDARVTNSYSTGTVQGKSNVGGIVGENFISSIISCYSTGTVIGEDNVGGLIGYKHEVNPYSSNIRLYRHATTLTANYWNIETSEQAHSYEGEIGKVEGKTSAEMKMQNTYVDWDFTRKWSIEEGVNYPQLQALPPTPAKDGDTYLISNLNDLYWLSQQPTIWDADFKLTANIDASETKNQKGGFPPIGNDYNRFMGSFNGQGYVISNLYINRPQNSNIGLFAYIDSATVENVGIVDCNITGKDAVGGLIGNSTASVVRYCYVTGDITGYGYDIGGLIGEGNASVLINCYAKATMHGNGNYLGGFIGRSSDTLTANYWDIEISGQVHSYEEEIGKAEGKTSAEMKKQSTYAGWDFDTIWDINPKINHGYPYLRNVEFYKE